MIYLLGIPQNEMKINKALYSSGSMELLDLQIGEIQSFKGAIDI